jgi:putative membrane protein
MAVREQDRTRIANAVTEAEKSTSGEIVVVLANDVSSYREIPIAYAAAAALVLPALAVWLGVHPLATPVGATWTAEPTSAFDAKLGQALAYYGLVQAIVFAIVYAFVAWKPVRRALTPGFIKRERAHKAAMAQFLATGLDGSPDRTGVVIFAALDDHVVEIIADSAIHAKVGPGAWNQAIAAMQEKLKAGAFAEGFERGIALCGAALAAHFPPGDSNPNTHSDAPRVI